MRKLVFLLTILLLPVSGCSLTKDTPLEGMTGRISSTVSDSIASVTGNAPEQRVKELYEDFKSGEFQNTEKVFAIKARKFYNSTYLKNVYGNFPKEIAIKISKVEKNGKTARIYHNLDEKTFIIAEMVKENGDWKIANIQDDPAYVVD